MNTSQRRMQIWGWGYEDLQPTEKEKLATAKEIATSLGNQDISLESEPKIDDIELRTSRIKIPDTLSHLCSISDYDRAAHTYGKGFPDVMRAFRLEFSNPPDVVAFPENEQDVVSIVDWCDETGTMVIPFGGGSNTVGGVEASSNEGYPGIVSLDLRNLDKVLEIDETSRAARIQAGVFGPALEEQLRPHGLTLRHFPQSFECSSLGGWIATRSGGHFATLYTHIDDFVESLRLVSPTGMIESRRLPGSGAGPSPDRMFIGSEGILGIITEAWMRLQHRPVHRAPAAVRFDKFEDGVEAVRILSQTGLFPANCRLLDPIEVKRNKVGDGKGTMLMLGFESADHPVDAWLARAMECCADYGGEQLIAEKKADTKSGSVGDWRQAFIRMPYMFGTFAAMGAIFDTVESAIPWNQFDEFHDGVMSSIQSALDEICGGGVLSCRFTHVYPDGPAPYFTFLGLGKRGSEFQQWQEIKAAATEALVSHGGTVTHHHAVGRFNRPWYDKQRPELFANALRSAKASLDPNSIMNPGALIDP